MHAPAQESEAAGRQSLLATTFSAFKHRNYRLFWAGQFISLIGSWVQTVAHGWLVYDLTRSPTKLGIVSAAGSVPILLFSLLGGVAADRIQKRTILLWTQSLLALLALALGLLVATHRVRYEHILLVAFLTGTVNAVDIPTRQAFVVEMVGKSDLMNAIALNSAMFNSARLLGPVLAGLTISAFGVAPCYFINALSFVAVLIGLVMMEFQPNEHISSKGSAWEDLVAGIRYLRHSPNILMLIGGVAVPSVFGAPYAMLMPVFARDVLHGGPNVLGLLMSATGVGALMGALTLSALSEYPKRGHLLVGGGLLFAAFLILFSMSRWLPLSLLLLVGVGWAMITYNATTNTLVQTTVSDELRGRVMAVYSLMFIGLTPLGSLQAGAVAGRYGAPFAVAAGAVVCALFALFVVSPRALRWSTA